ncbi:VOC family protein [Chroococcus sp. FPU101]|uniref:VOC family protein n=1 Tax=Chroococcus sp. FPU101 TaxID=1974212 RepID=UPI001A8EA561|nr:VOC family protein [Chroococcus sp. FPU101]GFE69956.1 hypothetical protein CFPU101_25660 [Chroococcus sp. FPU101]
MSTKNRTLTTVFLSIIAFVVIIFAYQQPNTDANSTLHLTQISTFSAVQAVESVSITVSDMDQAVAFYSQVLSFQKISDLEVWGTEYEQLQGLFGIRIRVVRMQLGNEIIELIDYLTPGGKSIPIDSRSNERWFQHIAIVVSDIEQAYQKLREHKIQHVSTAPQRLPDYLKAAGIKAFYFRDPDGHNLEIISFPPSKGNPKW